MIEKAWIVQGFFCKIIDQVRPLKEKERATLILENSNMFCRATTPHCSLQAKLKPGEGRKPDWEKYSLYEPDTDFTIQSFYTIGSANQSPVSSWKGEDHQYFRDVGCQPLGQA
jgi:hypothetical protein